MKGSTRALAERWPARPFRPEIPQGPASQKTSPYPPLPSAPLTEDQSGSQSVHLPCAPVAVRSSSFASIRNQGHRKLNSRPKFQCKFRDGSVGAAVDDVFPDAIESNSVEAKIGNAQFLVEGIVIGREGFGLTSLKLITHRENPKSVKWGARDRIVRHDVHRHPQTFAGLHRKAKAEGDAQAIVVVELPQRRRKEDAETLLTELVFQQVKPDFRERIEGDVLTGLSFKPGANRHHHPHEVVDALVRAAQVQSGVVCSGSLARAPKRQGAGKNRCGIRLVRLGIRHFPETIRPHRILEWRV